MAVSRIVVYPKHDEPDPRGEGVRQQAKSFLGIEVAAVRSADIYLLEGDLSVEQLEGLARRLLADPVSQDYDIEEHEEVGAGKSELQSSVIEVHPLPGVMDPVAQSVEDSVLTLFGLDVKALTGVRYDFEGIDENDLKDAEDEKVDKAAEEASAKGDVDWDKEEEKEE